MEPLVPIWINVSLDRVAGEKIIRHKSKLEWVFMIIYNHFGCGSCWIDGIRE